MEEMLFSVIWLKRIGFQNGTAMQRLRIVAWLLL